jgi:hypothetical protein
MTTINEYRFSFTDVSVIYAGVSITGFTDGDDAIVITPRSDKYNSTVGADGNVVYTYVTDNSFTFQLKLLQTADSNTFLSTLYQTDRAQFQKPLPLIIRNAGGRDVYTANFAVISSVPTVQYGRNQNAKIWTLTAGNVLYFPGGNAPITS